MKVLLPTSVNEAVSMLDTSRGKTLPIAGGTDLLAHWPEHLDARDQTYLDLSGVDELCGHTWADDELIMGARATFWEIVNDQRAAAEMRLLVDAARTVGSIQIQTRGTWGGNIVNASPAADGVLALMALDATLELTGVEGTEEVRLDDFYLGYKQMKRREDQLLTRIRIPRRAYSFQSFTKVGTRKAQAITKVGLAIAKSDSGWRVAANSMAPTVRRCPGLERMLEDETPVRNPTDFLPAIHSDVSPIDDIRSTAAYREHVMARVLFHELAPICPWVDAASESE